MNQMLLSNGLTAEYPDQLTLRDLPAPRAGGLHALGGPATTTGDLLLDTIAVCPEFTVFANLEFTGQVDAAGLGALSSPAGAQGLRIGVPLDADQGALLLSECDGLLRWELPDSIEEASAVAGGLGAAAAPRRVAVFRSRYEPVPATDPGAAGLGFDAGVILKPLRKLVLRFLARTAAEGVSAYLERGLREGPTVLRRDASGCWAWQDLDSFAALTGGEGMRRVLLLVHGTFSSSRGSFGGLCPPQAAAAFLDGAVKHYDAIVGFDHRTLRTTVPENAAAIAAALGQLPGTEVRIDAIAFSRGGLVLRWLAEVLPTLSGRLRLERAVFVGCTNNGTLLADPPHWRALVDLYTNLVAAAARLATLVGGPGVAAPAETIGAALRGLLSFVQLLASEVIGGDAVPGLASMAPGGAVVARLNGPSASEVENPAAHYVCEADFDHRLFDDGALKARGLPRRLFLELADGLVDQLFGDAENDLVVDRASMSHLAPWLPKAKLAERRGFAATDGVYHTVYFDDPRVAAQLANWLL